MSALLSRMRTRLYALAALVDPPSPGSSRYYGTDSGGAKGFHALSGGGSSYTAGAGLTLTGSSFAVDYTEVQAADADLDTLAGSTPGATGLALLGAASESAALGTLGLTDRLAVLDVGDIRWARTSASGWVATGGGATPSSSGTVSTVYVAARRLTSHASGTTVNSLAGVLASTGANLVLDTGMDWTLWIVFRTPSSLASLREWIGAVSSNVPNSDTPPTNSIVARCTDGTDTQLQAYGRAGGSASAPVAFGPVMAVDTTYILRIRHSVADGKAYFGCAVGTDRFGSFGAEAEVTTLPASGTAMGWVSQGQTTLGGTAVTWLNGPTYMAPVCVGA